MRQRFSEGVLRSVHVKCNYSDPKQQRTIVLSVASERDWESIPRQRYS